MSALAPYAPAASHKEEGVGLIELALLFGWYVALVTSMPGVGALRYLLFLCLLVFMYPARISISQNLKYLWFVFLIPGLMCLSLIWTPEKVNGIRMIIALLISCLVMIYGATRATYNQLMIIFMSALAIAALASFLHPNTQSVFAGTQSADLGVFSQKNVLGKRMMILCIVSLVVLTHKGQWWGWRVLAVGFMALGYVLVIRSDSATALILTTAAMAMFLLLSGAWRQLARVKGLIPLSIIAGLILVVVGGFALSLHSVDPVEAGLELFGKNSTLTGRTVLWEHARAYIAQHPFLGAGIEGFWRPQQDEAVQIASTFKRVPYAYDFYFHNAYYEYGVTFGIPGMIVLAITLIIGLSISVANFFKHQDAQAAAGLVLAFIVLLRTFTESEFYSAAEINVMLFYTGAAFAVRRYNQERSLAGK